MPKTVDIKSIRASDIMNTQSVVIDPESTISDALAKMKKYDVSEIAVLNRDTLVGILSYSKLIKRRSLPLSTKIENIMSMPPKVKKTDSIEKIAEMFISTSYQSVPVTTGKKLDGFISRADMVKKFKDIAEVSELRTEEVMTGHSLVTIDESENVSKAMHIMRGLDEMSLPVVNKHGNLTGVVSAKNLTEYLKKPKKGAHFKGKSGEKKDINISIGSLMNTTLNTVEVDSSVNDVIDLMLKKNEHSIVIVDGDKPVGIVTERDIIEALAGMLDRKEVYVQISGLEDMDPMIYDDMYNIIGKHLKKIAKIYTPRIFNAHVVHHHQQDDLDKFTIHTRLNTDKGSFTAVEYDWDILIALDKSMDNLHHRVLKIHERQVDHRRKRR